MADQNAKHPDGARLAYPDGSVYVYLQAADDLDGGTYVDVNINHRLVKFRGGMRFSDGIVIEKTPKEWYTFMMIQPPQVKKETPVVG